MERWGTDRSKLECRVTSVDLIGVTGAPMLFFAVMPQLVVVWPGRIYRKYVQFGKNDWNNICSGNCSSQIQSSVLGKLSHSSKTIQNTNPIPQSSSHARIPSRQEAKDVTAFLQQRLKRAMDTRDLAALSAKDAHRVEDLGTRVGCQGRSLMAAIMASWLTMNNSWPPNMVG